MKNKIVSIIKYNVERNIRSKWFVILNILLLLITLIGVNFSTVRDIFKKDNIKFKEDTEIILCDEDNLIYDDLNSTLKDIDGIKLTKETGNKEYTKENVEKNQIIVMVNKEGNSDIKAKVVSQEGVSSTYIDLIQNSLNNAKKTLYAKENNISIESLNEAFENVNIERQMLSIDNTDTDKKYTMQTIFNYLIFFILLMILSKIANDISQEKVTKSIEYVLTSISEKGYLIAKVLSINLTFILQLIFTVLYLILAFLINAILKIYFLMPNISLAQNVDMSGVTSIIDTNLVIYFTVAFIYLLLTIFILSIIQAILSSKTTNISDAGNATVILVTVNLVIYLLSTFLVTPLKSPTIFSYIISCVPIASMYFVPTMVLIGQANIIQVIIATLALVISCILLVKYGAKVFKNGVLDYKNIKEKEDLKQNTYDMQMQKIAKREYSKIGFVLGISVLIFVLLQLGLTYILQIFNLPIYNLFNGKISITNINTIIQIISFVISLVIPALMVFAYTEKSKEKKKVNIKSCIKYILICLPIVLGVQIVVGIVLEKLGLNYDILDKVNIYDDKSILGKILMFVEVALLPAIFEELYVRKAILNFTKKYGTVFAIISSSLLFSVIHFNLSQMLFAFIMGIILSIITLKSGSIIPSFTIHLLNNGYEALMLIFENNLNMIKVINGIYIILIVLGIICIIKEIIKSKGKIQIFKNIEIENNEEFKKVKKYRYIACDYSFILAVIVCITLLISMQKILTIL